MKLNFNQEMVLVVGAAFLVGYVIFLTLLSLLPRRLRGENGGQSKVLLEKAYKRREQVLNESRKRFEERFALTREEMEENVKDRLEDLKITEAELASQEESMKQTEARLQKQEKDVEHYQAKVAAIKQKYDEKIAEVAGLQVEVNKRLETISECNGEDLRKRFVTEIVTERQLDTQKKLKEIVDDLNTHSKKLADRMLSRLLSRYEPQFFWPKAVNHVDLGDQKIVELLKSESHPLIKTLAELTEGVEIELVEPEEQGHQYVIRLGGGYGIYKEAARLTLEEVLGKGPNAWAKADQVYLRHKTTLDRQALKLGRQAIRELRLHGIHDEIQKMVGALNWRTSYRQNQYHHSVEVAKLAGLLASELGVDPDMAKRCGLLHDIGKGIDYRIEGSHAVISGDYADRYGEKRLICDTVMSHHNDLVLETTMSYVLKTADTLSGARPGARVNLEEGYQIRLSAIDQAVRSFPGIAHVAIMNGGREVHVEVNHKKVRENEIENLTKAIARKIEEEVKFPGQIKVLVTRKFEVVAVA